jgi:hypothetical protein
VDRQQQACQCQTHIFLRLLTFKFPKGEGVSTRYRYMVIDSVSLFLRSSKMAVTPQYEAYIIVSYPLASQLLGNCPSQAESRTDGLQITLLKTLYHKNSLQMSALNHGSLSTARRARWCMTAFWIARQIVVTSQCGHTHICMSFGVRTACIWRHTNTYETLLVSLYTIFSFWFYPPFLHSLCISLLSPFLYLFASFYLYLRPLSIKF